MDKANETESTAPSFISATIKPSPTSLLGTGPWIYLLLRVPGGVRAEWADSLSCPCALGSCKLPPLSSYSEAALPEWHTTVPPTWGQHIWNPSSLLGLRRPLTFWPLLLFPTTTPSSSLLEPHWPFYYEPRQVPLEAFCPRSFLQLRCYPPDHPVAPSDFIQVSANVVSS